MATKEEKLACEHKGESMIGAGSDWMCGSCEEPLVLATVYQIRDMRDEAFAKGGAALAVSLVNSLPLIADEAELREMSARDTLMTLRVTLLTTAAEITNG